MAKRVRISDDDGATWITLPGNSGEFSQEAGAIDDTVFGKEFGSSQGGMISWSVNANSFYKGFAGYKATIKRSGTTTAMTEEAMTLVSGKTYKITNAAKNLWDRTAVWTVEVGGDPVAPADILSIDYLFGTVTFQPAYTPSGAVTVTGKYFPTAPVGCANGFTLTQTTNAIDETCMDTAAANGGYRVYNYGLKTASLDLNGIFRTTNSFQALLATRAEVLIEINPDGEGKSVVRGWFKAVNVGQSGDVGALEQETVTFNLSVPEGDEIPYPLHWTHAVDTTLSLAVRKCLDAWEAKDIIKVAYLPDGVDGLMGDGVLVDVTLTGGLEVMNEFAVNVQGSGLFVDYEE